jgi:hypothetical protein
MLWNGMGKFFCLYTTFLVLPSSAKCPFWYNHDIRHKCYSIITSLYSITFPTVRQRHRITLTTGTYKAQYRSDMALQAAQGPQALQSTTPSQFAIGDDPLNERESTDTRADVLSARALEVVCAGSPRPHREYIVPVHHPRPSCFLRRARKHGQTSTTPLAWLCALVTRVCTG